MAVPTLSLVAQELSLLDLPIELDDHLFGHLSTLDLLAVKLTCKHYRSVLDGSILLWRRRYGRLTTIATADNKCEQMCKEFYTLRRSARNTQRQEFSSVFFRAIELNYDLALQGWLVGSDATNNTLYTGFQVVRGIECARVLLDEADCEATANKYRRERFYAQVSFCPGAFFPFLPNSVRKIIFEELLNHVIRVASPHAEYIAIFASLRESLVRLIKSLE